MRTMGAILLVMTITSALTAVAELRSGRPHPAQIAAAPHAR